MIPAASNVAYLPRPHRETAAGASPPLPLIINGRFLTRRTTGVERVARGIVDALDERVDADGLLHHDGVALRPRIHAPRGDTNGAPRRIPLIQYDGMDGNLWEQIELPRAARDGVLLNLCNTAPLFASAQTTFVHDAGVYAVSRSYDWRFRAWYKCLHRAYRLRDDVLLTNSVFSARELQHYAGFSRDRLHVVMPGCDHVHAVEHAPLPPIVDMLAHGRGYFVVVASQAWHKSIDTAIEAHRRFLRLRSDGPVLLMIGGERRDIFGHDVIESGAEDPDLLRLGYLDDPTLVAILRRARALVFPSRYEGFGLPLAEAMALGCPVISSDLPTAKEIGVDACWTFPTDDCDALAAAMGDVVSRPDCVAERVAIGRQRAANLTWDACAASVLATVVHAAKSRRRLPA